MTWVWMKVCFCTSFTHLLINSTVSPVPAKMSDDEDETIDFSGNKPTFRMGTSNFATLIDEVKAKAEELYVKEVQKNVAQGRQNPKATIGMYMYMQ